jgi:hypothetical protein
VCACVSVCVCECVRVYVCVVNEIKTHVGSGVMSPHEQCTRRGKRRHAKLVVEEILIITAAGS